MKNMKLILSAVLVLLGRGVAKADPEEPNADAAQACDRDGGFERCQLTCPEGTELHREASKYGFGDWVGCTKERPGMAIPAKIGPYREWFPAGPGDTNGQLKKIGQYKGDAKKWVRDGIWRIWDTDGKGTFNETRCSYKNGKGRLLGKGKAMWCKQTE